MNKIVHLKGLIEPKGNKIPTCQRSPCFHWYKEGFWGNLDSRIYFQNLLRDSLAKAKEKFEKIKTSCPQDIPNLNLKWWLLSHWSSFILCSCIYHSVPISLSDLLPFLSGQPVTPKSQLPLKTKPPSKQENPSGLIIYSANILNGEPLSKTSQSLI